MKRYIVECSDSSHFRKGNILKGKVTGLSILILTVYDKCWWIKVLRFFGFKLSKYRNVIKVTDVKI
jgi:hypothetical protein